MVGTHTGRRAPLSRDAVLVAAVALADEAGLDAVSMRNLSQRLGVVPMALYKHVSNKDELVDGMVDVVVGEIERPPSGAGPRDAVRARILSARRALQRHPWAPRAIETRTGATPVVLDHMNALAGDFLTGGFSADLTHHAMHALGSRMWGFTQEVFPTPSTPEDPEVAAAMFAAVSQRHPHIVTIATASDHDPASAVGPGTGCDDQFEFEFVLDLLLDGFERLHGRGWSSSARRPASGPGR
ncbi:MAG TPA: TetR/AcrR family transcriptional regulator [Ornithinibacter sp.]|nr:TetR/AcrR family transcriptional regulator [Ornithinibacter sp.]